MRLSIEVTPDQHKQLKMIAALQGKSLKEYVLERTLPDSETEQSLKQLEAFLDSRVKSAKDNKISTQSVEDIFQQVATRNSQL